MVLIVARGVLLAAAPASPLPSTLKEAYGKWFALGVALPGKGLTDAEINLVASQFTNITTENCLKAANVHPAEATYLFDEGDNLVALAQRLHLKVNGHNLVWHSACPDWFFQDRDKPASRDLVLERMRAHIAAVVGHYRGKIASWDVVNEALSDKPGEYLRKTRWEQAIGDDYILQAYLAAQKADPAAELYYNDYSIERPAKRANALRLIADLRAHGARVDGVGIQGHWISGKVPFQDIEDSIKAFHDAGLKVMITELDLDVVPRQAPGADVSQREQGTGDPYVNGCPPQVLRQQAVDYAALFTLFRKHAAEISRVTFWNLDDGRSWLNKYPRKRTDYPLLWDRNLQPKPAFYAVMAAAIAPPDAQK
jgi:endo-1,4-beta-xylanase